jgi:DnaK suppressor protein
MANNPKNLPRAARSEEVLAQIEEKSIDRKWRGHYEKLIDLRAELLKRKSELAKDVREQQPAFSLHLAAAGTDHYDRDLALSIISSEQDAIYEVEEALRRIRDGNYGICQSTGEPIEAGRLNAIPWTRFCASVEKQLEADGAVGRTRLGRLAGERNDGEPADGKI